MVTEKERERVIAAGTMTKVDVHMAHGTVTSLDTRHWFVGSLSI